MSRLLAYINNGLGGIFIPQISDNCKVPIWAMFMLLLILIMMPL